MLFKCVNEMHGSELSACKQRLVLTMPHSKINLVLISARKSRSADFWDKDDYDVRLGDGSGPVIGRIMRPSRRTDELGRLDIRQSTSEPFIFDCSLAHRAINDVPEFGRNIFSLET
jgi:hypothetical protein